MKRLFAAAVVAAFFAAISIAAPEERTFVRSMERIYVIDPVKSQSAYEARAVQLMYETILSIDYAARPYRLAPGTCEVPEPSADGLRYSLRLVPGAAVTAEDVAAVFKNLADPERASPGAWTVKNVKSVRVADPRTVEVELHSRSHVFPWLLAMSNFCVVRADGSGTGPYNLVSWRKNHEMVFRKNPECPFWKSGVNTNAFDTIRYLFVGDVSTQWLMFLKGETMFLGDISRDNWDAVITGDGKLDPLLQSQGVRLYSAPTLDVRYVGFNMRDPVVGKNKALRQALTAAFDFEAWRRFYNGKIDPMSGPVPTTVEGCLDEPTPFPHDVERAKRLLAEAGYPGGIDPKTGRRLVLTLLLGSATQDARESGELLASFFDRIGVRLELEFCTWSAFLKAVNDGRMQLYSMAWVADYPDAENFLQLFHSRNVSPGANHSYYVNPEYDAEFDAAMDSGGAAERNRHWRRCQEILREDCPWIFTHSQKAFSLVRGGVGNYIPTDFPYGQEMFLECKAAEGGKETGK